jgi:hypothetical protein
MTTPPARLQQPGAETTPADQAPRPPQPSAERVLCSHCGRTASNGISCQGICVADSGY